VTVYFLDSSALVKRYIAEVGTAWVQMLADTDAGNSLFIARIAWVEVLSAFARRQREGVLNAAEVDDLVDLFRTDLIEQYQVVEIAPTLAETAGRLIVQYPLRAYDAVQLAAALQIQAVLSQAENSALMFLSADERLLTVASTVGLATENPNQHQ